VVPEEMVILSGEDLMMPEEALDE